MDSHRPSGWFAPWLRSHQRVNMHSMYPKVIESPKTEADREVNETARAFYGAWLKAFDAMNITSEEATEASQWLATQGGVFPPDMLACLLKRIKQRRLEVMAEVESAIRRREAAEHAKRMEALNVVKREWDAAPEEVREDIRRAVIQAHPFLGQLKLGTTTLMLCLESFQNLKGVAR